MFCLYDNLEEIPSNVLVQVGSGILDPSYNVLVKTKCEKVLIGPPYFLNGLDLHGLYKNVHTYFVLGYIADDIIISKSKSKNNILLISMLAKGGSWPYIIYFLTNNYDFALDNIKRDYNYGSRYYNNFIDASACFLNAFKINKAYCLKQDNNFLLSPTENFGGNLFLTGNELTAFFKEYDYSNYSKTLGIK